MVHVTLSNAIHENCLQEAKSDVELILDLIHMHAHLAIVVPFRSCMHGLKLSIYSA